MLHRDFQFLSLFHRSGQPLRALIALGGLALMPLLAGCPEVNGQPNLAVEPAATQCLFGSANLTVSEGFLQINCGCQESGGVQIFPPNSLTCTVPAGTTVFFNYLATTNVHQIVPVDGQSFQASPISNPIDPGTMLRMYPIVFNTPGSYPFFDQYNHAMNGTIVVQ